ncbi:unnamed protein product, partial [Echinostoma caproni]|uniref:Uncharacterized protein n=1 Tax=Echinostoma caproni TaxID=27848 RepID=A0A183AZR7_9TREM
MSVLRGQGDRGPADSHILDRFSTTYSASYRPFEETRRTIPIQCVSNSKSGSGLDTSARVSRGSRFWPISNESGSSPSTNVTIRSGEMAHTAASYQPSISRVLNPLNRLTTENGVGGAGQGTHRSWDDTALVNSTGLSVTDRPRPRPPGLSMSSTIPYRTTSNVGASDLSNGNTPSATSVTGNKDSNTRNYTSTYTTVVSDKLTPCFAISNGTAQTKATAITQTDKPISGFCPPSSTSSRTGTTASIGATRTDHSCTDLGVNKRCLNSGTSPAITTTSTSSPLTVSAVSNSTSTERPLHLTTISPYQSSTHFDFGQMFSQIARINNHLYLSSLNALTPDRLRQHGITLLISAMIDPVPPQLRNAVTSSMHVPVEDVEGANL